MKQVVQSQSEGKVRVEEVPEPVLRRGGVLVRVCHSLVSAGTERAKVELAQKSLMAKARAKPEHVRQVLGSLRSEGLAATYRKVANRLAALQPLGYSSSGVVVAVADDVDDLSVGDRVACAGAGYANHAEYAFIPRNLCVRVPGDGGAGGSSLQEAAFATVGAIALHGVRLAEVALGDHVAVLGLGLVGLLAVQMLKGAGCRVIGMDPNPVRCELGTSLGCTATQSQPEHMFAAVTELTSGAGVDAVLLCAATSSDEPVSLAGQLCRDRGRVVVVGDVGMRIPRDIYYAKELELRISRSYGPGRYDPEYEQGGHDYPIGYVRWTERRNLQAFLRLVDDGTVRVQPLISHHFPVDRAPEAYDLITSGQEPYLGILLDYPDAAAAAPGDAVPSHRISVGKSVPASTLTVGLIGCGNFAQDTLLPALRSDSRVRLHTVVSASGISGRSVAQRFGFQYAAASADDILNDPAIHCVIIATRHDEHAALTIKALRAGKHVFVEKPLALDPQQLDEIIDAYRSLQSAPCLMVGFNRRFAPATRALRDFLRDVTDPLLLNYRINAGYLPPTHWLHDPQQGGGRVVGEACHFVDLLRWLAASPVVEVQASALPDLGRYRHDNVTAQIRFANGSIGLLQYLANGDKGLPKERLEVFGGGLAATLNDFSSVELSRGGRVKRVGGWLSGKDKGHRSELRAFVGALTSGGPPPIGFDDLVATTQVTFAIQKSISIGGAVAPDLARAETLGIPQTAQVDPVG